MTFVCSQCSNSFITKSSLFRHQRTAKYCSKLENESHECRFCSYQTKLKHNLYLHQEGCKSKNKIEPLEDRIKELESLLEQETEANRSFKKDLNKTKTRNKKLKEQVIDLTRKLDVHTGQLQVYKERPSSVVNNNYVNTKLLQVKCDTIRPFTIETVREDINDGKYTFEQYIKAERGLVEFISDMTSFEDQRSYVCTDSSRKKFHRLLDSREWKEDNEATFLNKVLDELKEPATIYYKKITDMMTGPLEDRDLADILYDKTKPMTMGIVNPKTKDRELTFAKIRSEVKNLASV